jgi:hypothetical protein
MGRATMRTDTIDEGSDRVTFLFDSSGRHVANLVRGQLHAPRGPNIGHWLENQQIFIDMHGRYLGEIIAEDRLMYRTNSAYRSTNFGNHGNYGSAGNYGNPGRRAVMARPGGFADVATPWL